jgi:hypothetical protein
MNKRTVFFIIGITVIIISILIINILIRSHGPESEVLETLPKSTGQGSASSDVAVEKEKAPAVPAPQEEPETELPIKAGEQLLR